MTIPNVEKTVKQKGLYCWWESDILSWPTSSETTQPVPQQVGRWKRAQQKCVHVGTKKYVQEFIAVLLRTVHHWK